MHWLLAALLFSSLSGVPGLFTDRQGPAGERIACLLLLSAATCGILSGFSALSASGPLLLNWPWAIPGGAIALKIDPLAALFLLPLCVVSGVGSIYGLAYWRQCDHPENGRKFRLFYGLIVAAVMLLLTADHSLLFLVAWEIMALSSFFVITTEERHEEARKAGFIYLIATHTGTLALFAMFVLLEQATGSFLFPAAEQLFAATPAATAIFLFGLFGFGLKAGLFPLHIWLPAAHAAAPSHGSALLSGVMIKTGIYGLIRLTSFFTEIPFWWGGALLALGAVSAIFGVVLALAQHDIKRLLAYHSVENIGIITLGLGMALAGRSQGHDGLILLGLGGALLHVVNHGLFKSLLFFAAGSVVHATGTREINRYGGLFKRQPWTAALFLGGAIAISGLPPFNGFISEWLIYVGAFSALREGLPGGVPVLLVAPALALTGGLALACFVKVFGVTFLGAARSEESLHAHEAPHIMRAPMLVLLGCCAGIGLLPQTLAPLLRRAVASWGGGAGPMPADLLSPLGRISVFVWGLLLLAAALFGWLSRRSRRAPRDLDTWGCGYVAPNRRMQYSAGSFADFLIGLFRFGLWTERHGDRVTGLFPLPGRFSSHTPDPVLDRGLEPAFAGVSRLFRRLRAWLQNGRIAFYLLYVALTLISMLLLIR